MTAPAALEMPPLPPSFGDTSSPDAVAAAVDQLTKSPATPNAGNDPGKASEGAQTEPGATAGAGVRSDDKKKRGRPFGSTKSSPVQQSQPPLVADGAASGGDDATDSETGPLSSRAIQRIPRPKLRKTLLRVNAELTAAQTRLAQLDAQQKKAVAVDPDQAAKSLRGMLGDVIGLMDTGAQLVVGDHLAAVVRVTDEEKAHVVELAEPVARQHLGEYVNDSPMIALAIGVGSLILAKYLAVRDAKQMIVTRQAETPRAVEVAVSRSTKGAVSSPSA